MLGKVIVEIGKYLETDVTPNERDYFQSKIEKFKKIKNTTDQKAKEDLIEFVRKNEKLFNEVGYFNRLWPELSFLLD